MKGLELSCLCGAVKITLNALPGHINECNCTLCRKSGASWGYYEPGQVEISGETNGYQRADKQPASVEVHSCIRCGATTHFQLTEAAIAEAGNTVIGINMALSDPSELAGVELRYPDGLNWNGEGDFGYVREPRVL